MSDQPRSQTQQSPLLSRIPALDQLLRDPALAPLHAAYGASRLKATLRPLLEDLRCRILSGDITSKATLSAPAIARQARDRLQRADQPHLRPVFNLTGTVLHTNLGRAVMPDQAVQAVTKAMQQPVNLEYDLDSGRRGDRDALVEDLVCELTGAEAATIVNNNAAAVLLMLNSLADQAEVVVSRGELVEIGGSFRIPDVMRSAGAQLVEVGTTNRTHARDYTRAIGPETGLLMQVHTSNYVVTGFTAAVETAELARLGRGHDLPVAVDLGSGSLLDLRRWDLPDEPSVRSFIDAGAAIVSFSGDKLLGGPQAGILAGRADLIEQLKNNPLKRALRADKMTLAALEAVLNLYRSPEFVADELTSLRLLTRPAADMATQAQRLAPTLQNALGASYQVTNAAMNSQIGSGALPVANLPSHGLVIRARDRDARLSRLEKALRSLPRPVIGRLQEQALWLDLRCLETEHEADFLAQLESLQL